MDNVERIKHRHNRKQRKQRIKTVTTPYPISCCIEGELNGSLLKYMFPCSGKIIKVCVRFDTKPKETVNVNVVISGEINSRSQGFSLDKKTYSVKTDISVNEMDVLEASAIVQDSAKVSKIYIAFLWEPIVADSSIKSFLLEDLFSDDETTKGQVS